MPQYLTKEEVAICDGINTGKIGVVGGYKGQSVAICIKDFKGHDCDGMCPNGGTYEPEYALLPITSENKQAVELLLAHLRLADKQALLEEINEWAEKNKTKYLRNEETSGLTADECSTYRDGFKDAYSNLQAFIKSKNE